MQVLSAPVTTMSVLVADPDQEARTLYRQSFGDADYQMIEALDGRDALVKALVQRPSLVVTELGLHMVDGYALCQILRADRLTADVPILVVTATGDSASCERARRAGADAVLVKPVSREQVRQEAERLIAYRERVREQTAETVRAREASQIRKAASLSTPSSRARTAVAGARPRTAGRPSALARDPLCPACDRALSYKRSRVNESSHGHAERWDDYSCPHGCGNFEYRRGSRRVRRVG